MKDIFLQELQNKPQDLKLHLLREKLQHLILHIIDQNNYFSKIIFLGGTALRVLFNTKRFSEDLDFSFDITQHKKLDFDLLVKDIQKNLSDYGFRTETRKKTEGAVNNCFFKFPDILYQLSKVFRNTQKLAIRLDIDTNPPAGFYAETSAVEKDFLLKIRHFDKASLFAGKLNAILCRNYLKGRDIYDFIWFCANNIPVNLTLLNNGYTQTQKKTPPWTKDSFNDFMSEKMNHIDLHKAYNDASFFMEDLEEKRFFDKDLLCAMAKKIHIVNI